ncbi:MAG: nicotinate-nucleotide diphosphorylase (carboxylating) [Rhodospirillaceae bacterium]|nr:MAG: nicotinate-nucleotide diphosphorylase (carboxylating) [Rhodospirillaceae bacterium]
MQPNIPDSVDNSVVISLIYAAMAEDIGKNGDITSDSVIPEDVNFSGMMVARHSMCIAGLGLAGLIFKSVNPDLDWQSDVEDGEFVKAGTVLATISGCARDLLMAERTALNLLQHLSGIATLAHEYVDAIKGTGAYILDTRKTVPMYRELAKYASRMGGVTNHRMRLDDLVLIKDNHIAVAGDIVTAITRAKAAGHTILEVECDDLDQVKLALNEGVDAILLDNMSLDQLREAVDLIGDQARTEASGGVNLETVRAIAETGVKSISVGRITQSAPSVDIGLDWKP